jgi:hypothetical protein
MTFASLSRLMDQLRRWLCGDRTPRRPRWMARPRPAQGADDPYATLQPEWRLRMRAHNNDQ